MRFASRRIVATFVAVLTLTGPRVGSQSKFEVFKLAPSSPLATDGSLVFGVADDERTVLIGSGAGGDWKVLARRPTPRRVSGLAWERGVLYLSDDESRAVYRLRLDETGARTAEQPDGEARAELIFPGAPLERPTDLAFAGGLIVADPAARSVFRIDRDKRTIEAVAGGLPAGPLYLAADRKGMVVTSPDAGEVRQPVGFTGAGITRLPSSIPLSVWRTRERNDASPDGTGMPTAVPQRRFPLIVRPTAPAVARGSIYLIDAADASIYVAFRQLPRPMRVSGATPVKRPTRLLVLGDSLLVLDGSRGVLDRWPLPVPTEVALGADVGEALDALYGYLHEERVLPVRTVPWRGAVETTLKDENIVGARGQILSKVTCALNPSFCKAATWSVPANTAIVVPDLPIESVVDLETITAADLGDRTLGEEVDRRIVTPAFHDYRNEDELWELNASRMIAIEKGAQKSRASRGWGPYLSQGFRGLKASDFPPGFTLTIPVEKVRCLVALPRRLLIEDAGLSRIRLRSAGFNWNPLEEGEAKAYSADDPVPLPAPQACDVATLTKKHTDLLSTIHFKAVPPAAMNAVVRVGVVEEKGIDVHHAAFGGAQQAFSMLAPAAAAPVPAPPLMCKTGTEETDHGTAVASLIAARAGAGHGLQGVAPDVQIVPLRSTDEFAGNDLLLAYRAPRRVRIFNMSVHYNEKRPLNVRLKVNELKGALFVVAAGNDATEHIPVCESARPYPAYPVCEGYRRNVLVVAATNADGVALIEKSDNTPGSNWNDQLVHIAAPGTGFYAAGRDNTYVPVRGTSFATPLVSATAALLYGQGVTDPWLLKQRIIATADQRDSLIGKVFGAGLLNVERAVTAPALAVLGTTSPPTLVSLEDDPISIKWQGGERTVPLSNVRRLTRNLGGQTYRVVYLDDVTDTLVIQEGVNPGPWPFNYKRVNAAGAPTGAAVADNLELYPDYVGPIL